MEREITPNGLNNLIFLKVSIERVYSLQSTVALTERFVHFLKFCKTDKRIKEAIKCPYGGDYIYKDISSYTWQSLCNDNRMTFQK